MDQKTAENFAAEWINAWNSHSIDKILSHYDDEFEMSSPAIVALTGEASGTLKGKDSVGKYWQVALKKYTNLHFKLLHVFCGADSISILYQGVLGLSNEVFFFGEDGKIIRAYAHYESAQKS